MSGATVGRWRALETRCLLLLLYAVGVLCPSGCTSMLDAPLPTQTSQDCCISKQRLALVHSVVNEAQMG